MNAFVKKLNEMDCEKVEMIDAANGNASLVRNCALSRRLR